MLDEPLLNDCLTVSTWLLVSEPNVAWIVAVSVKDGVSTVSIDVARPAMSIVATPCCDDVHATNRVISSCAPLEKPPVATYCCVSPKPVMVAGLDGVVICKLVGGVTDNVADPDVGPRVATIAALPNPCQVRRPVV